MSPADEPSHEHQVGITNAQEQNPDAEIRRLTAQMNVLFAAKQYAEAARIALSITALSKDELRETFNRHGVQVLHLDSYEARSGSTQVSLSRATICASKARRRWSWLRRRSSGSVTPKRQSSSPGRSPKARRILPRDSGYRSRFGPPSPRTKPC